jgi:hypothetical protein
MTTISADLTDQPNLCSYKEPLVRDGSATVTSTNISKLLFPKSINPVFTNIGGLSLATGYFDFAPDGYIYYGEEGEKQDTGYFTFFGSYSVANAEIEEQSDIADMNMTTLIQSVTGTFCNLWNIANTSGWGLVLWNDGTDIQLKLFISDNDPPSGGEDFTLYTLATFDLSEDVDIDFAISFDFSQSSTQEGILNSFVYDYHTKSTITRNFDTQTIDLIELLYLGGGDSARVKVRPDATGFFNYLKSTNGIYSRFLFFNRLTLNKIDDFLALKNYMPICSSSQIGLASAESSVLGVESYTVATGEVVLKNPSTFTSLNLNAGDYILVGNQCTQENSALCVGFAKIATLTNDDTLTINSEDSLGVTDLSIPINRVFTVFRQNQNIQFEELEHLSSQISNVSNLIWSDVYQSAFPDINFKKSEAIRIISAPSFLQYKYENTIILFTMNDIYRFVLSDTPENWGSSSTALIKDKVGFGLYAKDSVVFTSDAMIWLSSKGIIVWDVNGIKNVTKDKNNIKIDYDLIGGYIPETNQYVLEDGTVMWKYDLTTGAITTGYDYSIVANTPNYITGKMIYATTTSIRTVPGYTAPSGTPEVITPTYLLNNKSKIRRMNLQCKGNSGELTIYQNQDGSLRNTAYSNLSARTGNIALANIWGESFYFKLTDYSDIYKLTLEIMEG